MRADNRRATPGSGFVQFGIAPRCVSVAVSYGDADL